MIRLENGEIDLDSVPLDDEATFQGLCAGNSVGVFQLESPGMREMMLSLQPTVIDDIAALVALYRPGPLESGIHKMYINRKHGRERVVFEHPALEQVLGPSYGVMLYQEDVLNVAKTLAGFSAAEADDLRKVMGKKLMTEVEKYREVFVAGCKKTNDVPPVLANKIYSDIAKFAGYGFNRAHAFSYGLLAYLTAYFKFHFPAEYMAGLLTSVASGDDRLPLYLTEAKRLGLTVLPPSVNHSEGNFRVVNDGEIRFGLTGIKGIGGALVDQIVRFREPLVEPPTTIQEWMRVTSPEVLKKDALEHLTRSGAFDELVETPKRNFNQDQTMALLAQERHEIGVYLTMHPLESVAYLLETMASHQVADLEACSDGENVTLGGIISQVVAKTTKRGDLMYRLEFEDMTKAIEVLVFPKDANRWKDKFQQHQIVLIEGRVSRDDENSSPKLFFSDMKEPDLPVQGRGKPVILEFHERPNNHAIETLSGLVNEHPGDSPVFLRFREEPHVLVFQFNKTVDLEIESTLRDLGEVLDQPY